MNPETELAIWHKRLWKLERMPSIVGWCEKNIYLRAGGPTPKPGQLDLRYTPYTREVLEALVDPRVRQVILCWGAQTGKTTALMAWLSYRIANDPAPMLFVLPTESLARNFSQTRLKPMLDDCVPVRSQYPADTDKIKLLSMQFHRCSLDLVGSNSPASISSRPIEVLLLDEIDKFAPADEKEASALALAIERTKAFPRRKQVLTSTPTTETGNVWQHYLNGSREKFMVPCPKCQTSQELEFSRVTWDKDAKTEGRKWDMRKVGKSARYKCLGCEHEWSDSDKIRACENGKWVATNPSYDPEIRSFQLNSLYAPNITWADAAKKFLTTKNMQGGLQNWNNSWMGMPYIVAGESIEEEQVLSHSEEYELGQMPEKPNAILLTIDVQRDCIYYVVRGWLADHSSYLIEYGRAPNINEIPELMAREFLCGGEKRKIDICLVDSGFATGAVYEATQAYSGVFACKGWASMSAPAKWAKVDWSPKDSLASKKVWVLHFVDTFFKTRLYLETIRNKQGPKWVISKNVGNEYIKQLISERLVERGISRGVPKKEWVRIGKANHLGDCEKMQMSLAYVLGSSISGMPIDIAK